MDIGNAGSGTRATDLIALVWYTFEDPLLDGVRRRLWTRILDLVGREGAAVLAAAQILLSLEWPIRLGRHDVVPGVVKFRRGGFAITVFLLLVSAATLLVAMVDWLMERRRSLAVLSAVGVTASTVRRSIFAQVGLPLAASLVFGVAGAFAVTALLYRAVNQPVVFAGGQIAALAGVVVLVVLGVTAASAPWLRIARRPELLREA